MAELVLMKAKLKSKLKQVLLRIVRTRLIAPIFRTYSVLKRLPEVIEQIDRLAYHDNFLQSVPVALRSMARDNNLLRNQLQNVQTRHDSLQHQIWETQGQLKTAIDAFAYIPKRLEFVRSELMFEMRYGASSAMPQGIKPEKVQIEIIHPEKLATHRIEGFRLNLGCGHIPKEDYLNVDSRALPDVDIVADISSLPFGPSEVNEIFSSHVLEHFPQEQLRRQLLPYWTSLLKKGGVFVAIVPDADAMIQEYAKGDYLYNNLREVFFGAQDYDGDFHFNMFVPEQMKDLFIEAGLSNFEVIVRGRQNGACLEMEVRGYKE
jgi:predicted SAM-dependent methyltransferase